MHEFQFGPCQKALAQGLEERLQVRRGALLMQRWRFHLLVDVEVHERHRQDRQPELPARHRPVDLRLRPVQMSMVDRHEVEVALEGLDLLQQLPIRVKAAPAATSQISASSSSSEASPFWEPFPTRPH